MGSVSKGFSLIELLVVVAIIGILAAVGVVGYNGYINATKDETALSNADSVSRAFQQDYISIKNDLGGPSQIGQGVSSTTQCLAYVNTVVDKLNAIWKNAHNASDAYAVNLHDDDPPGSDAPIATLKPGQLGMQCGNPSATVDDSNFFMHRCTCYGIESCTLHTFKDGDGSANEAKYETHVNAIDPTLAWKTDNTIKLGTHVPDWVCPKAAHFD